MACDARLLPASPSTSTDANQQETRMTTTNDGGPAFPVTPTDRSGQIAPTEFGMSLRDYFAAKAMQASYLLHMEGTRNVSKDAASLASEAYAMADAMLAAREVK